MTEQKTKMDFEAFVADFDRIDKFNCGDKEEYNENNKLHYSHYGGDFIGSLPFFLREAKDRGINIELDTEPKITRVEICIQDLGSDWGRDVNPKVISYKSRAHRCSLQGNMFIGTDRNMYFPESYDVPILRSFRAEIRGLKEDCLEAIECLESSVRKTYNEARDSKIFIHATPLITSTKTFRC